MLLSTRLSLSLFHEDRMRLGPADRKTGFPAALRPSFRIFASWKQDTDRANRQKNSFFRGPSLTIHYLCKNAAVCGIITGERKTLLSSSTNMPKRNYVQPLTQIFELYPERGFLCGSAEEAPEIGFSSDTSVGSINEQTIFSKKQTPVKTGKGNSIWD